MSIEFEWDPAKARSNLAKHGVDFGPAIRVFDDPFALVEQEPGSIDEERWRQSALYGVSFYFWSRTACVRRVMSK